MLMLLSKHQSYIHLNSTTKSKNSKPSQNLPKPNRESSARKPKNLWAWIFSRKEKSRPKVEESPANPKPETPFRRKPVTKGHSARAVRSKEWVAAFSVDDCSSRSSRKRFPSKDRVWSKPGRKANPEDWSWVYWSSDTSFRWRWWWNRHLYLRLLGVGLGWWLVWANWAYLQDLK